MNNGLNCQPRIWPNVVDTEPKNYKLPFSNKLHEDFSIFLRKQLAEVAIINDSDVHSHLRIESTNDFN